MAHPASDEDECRELINGFFPRERKTLAHENPGRFVAIGPGPLTVNPRTVVNHEETQYLELIHTIIRTGREKTDRTGVGTLSIVGHTMRFSLRGGVMPLLTTKRVFWKGIVEELLFFLRGDTNANHLSDRGVRIWESNSSREFLDKKGFTNRAVGDIGPMYGWQWRHFGAEYKGMDADYTTQGFDQLRYVLDKLTTTPDARDIAMSAWNPPDLAKSVLAPCHVYVQFCAQPSLDGERGKHDLSCVVFQRSADVGLGVPFNIASYALLTHVIAKAVGMRPYELIYNTGDTHVYKNHIEPLKTQLSRDPRPFPVLDLSLWEIPTGVDKKELHKVIEALKPEQVKLDGYTFHPAIVMDMAV